MSSSDRLDDVKRTSIGLAPRSSWGKSPSPVRLEKFVLGTLCSVRLDLKNLAAPNYFYDLHTDGILARSDLLTVTNLAHYNHAIPLYLYYRPALHKFGDG